MAVAYLPQEAEIVGRSGGEAARARPTILSSTPTCFCSTSRRTISTSPGSSSWSGSSIVTEARSWSCRTPRAARGDDADHRVRAETRTVRVRRRVERVRGGAALARASGTKPSTAATSTNGPESASRLSRCGSGRSAATARAGRRRRRRTSPSASTRCSHRSSGSRSRGILGDSSLALVPGRRSGDVVARLEGAVVERGRFTLGPIDLEVRSGDRLVVLGRNGAGKTTLLRALLGELRWRGPALDRTGVVLGDLPQGGGVFSGERSLLDLPRGVGPGRGRGANAPREVRARRRSRPTACALSLAGRAEPCDTRAPGRARRERARPR